VGGTFTAAHYGLHGARSFDTFRADFLDQDIEAYIYGTFLMPWNWEWMINPLSGINDRMATVYDRLMFHGATSAISRVAAVRRSGSSRRTFPTACLSPSCRNPSS
jgi:hypothetical protein